MIVQEGLEDEWPSSPTGKFSKSISSELGKMLSAVCAMTTNLRILRSGLAFFPRQFDNCSAVKLSFITILVLNSSHHSRNWSLISRFAVSS